MYFEVCLVWIVLSVRNEVLSTESDGFVILEEQTWWNAKTECSKLNKQLFVPTDERMFKDVIPNSNESIQYWIGGLETFSSWKWAGNDGSNASLYTYIGSVRTTSSSDRFILPDNNPFSCDQQCATMTAYVGLQGDRCICIKKLGNETLNTSPDIRLNRCVGIFQDNCGNEEYISIYKSGLFPLKPYKWRPTDEGLCGFLKHVSDVDPVYVYTDDCTSERHGLCANKLEQPHSCISDICTTNIKVDWFKYSNSCTLLSLTEKNQHDIKTLIKPNENQFTYWTGLRRTRRWMWVNGDTIKSTIVKNSQYEERECVTMTTDGSSVEYGTESCLKKIPAICVNIVKGEMQQGENGTPITVKIIPGIIVLVIILIFLLIWLQRRIRKHKDDDSLYSYRVKKGDDMTSGSTLSRASSKDDVTSVDDESRSRTNSPSTNVNDGFNAGKGTAEIGHGLEPGSGEVSYAVPFRSRGKYNVLEQERKNQIDDINDETKELTQHYEEPLPQTATYFEVEIQHETTWRPNEDDDSYYDRIRVDAKPAARPAEFYDHLKRY